LSMPGFEPMGRGFEPQPKGRRKHAGEQSE